MSDHNAEPTDQDRPDAAESEQGSAGPERELAEPAQEPEAGTPSPDGLPAPEATPAAAAETTQSPAAGAQLPPMQPMQSGPIPMAPLAGSAPMTTPSMPAAWPYPQPTPVSVFDGFWPRPQHSGAQMALLAAAIGGVAAAVFVPLGSAGIGWPLLGLAVAVAMILVSRKAERKVQIGQWCWAAAAVLLLAVCVFRSASWLAALCVLTAGVAGVLAVTNGRSVPGFAIAAIAVPVAAFRALPWTFRGVRESGPGRGGLRIAATLGVTLVLLLVFGGLFAGADENFAELASAVLPSLDAESLFRWTFVLVPFAMGTLGAAFTLLRPPEPAAANGPARTLRPLEWALPIGVLVVLFAAFIAVQSTPMFGGDEHVQHTDRLTYANYARSGFWQLTAVTILTLPIIGAAARWAPKQTRFDRNLLRGLTGALAVLTLLIVASALIRMWAYQDAYGHTVMRLLVMTCELWLGLVYVLVIAAGVRLRANWLPTAVVGTAMAALLGLAALDPDAFIAERNIDRFEMTGKLDQEYLDDLSADAIPALQRLPEPMRGEIITEITEDLPSPGWRSWNLPDHLARTP